MTRIHPVLLSPLHGSRDRWKIWLPFVPIILIVASMVHPMTARFWFRWSFASAVWEYEDGYRKTPMTCYRMWDMEHTPFWLPTLTTEDYASELFSMRYCADPEIRYWAQRTLVRSYGDSPYARRMIYELIDNPRSPIEDRLSAALVLRDWGDHSRFEKVLDSFRAARDGKTLEGTMKYWLGLSLAEQGVPEGARYALRRFIPEERYVRREIARRLVTYRTDHPDRFQLFAEDPDPQVRRGWEIFSRWNEPEPEVTGGPP